MAPKKETVSTPTDEQATSVSYSLSEKVINLTREIGTLVKNEQNKEQKYAYVSIDGYYELVAHRAAEAGLTWKMRVLDSKHIGNETSRSGNVAPVFLFTFAFDLMDRDGNFIENFAVLPVSQVLRGPQGAGSAISYADKFFMRTTFKVATKEGDGDEESQRVNIGKPEVRGALDFGPPKEAAKPPAEEKVKAEPTPAEEKATPAPAAQSTSEVKAESKVDMPSSQDWANVAKVFKMGLGTMSFYNDLVKFWRDNQHVLDEMQKTAPAVFEDLVAEFKKVGGEMKKKEGIQ